MTRTEPIQKLSIVVPPMCDLQFREQRAEDHAAGEDADRDLRDDERDDRNDREDVAGTGAEAALEKLRHGEDLRAHVEGNEDPGENEQAPGVQFVVRQRDAAGRARSGEADDVLRADVRREDRCADDPPARGCGRRGSSRCVVSLPLRTTHHATHIRMPK